MRYGAWVGFVIMWLVIAAHALLIRLKMLAYAAPAGAGRAVPRRHPKPAVLAGPHPRPMRAPR